MKIAHLLLKTSLCASILFVAPFLHADPLSLDITEFDGKRTDAASLTTVLNDISTAKIADIVTDPTAGTIDKDYKKLAVTIKDLKSNNDTKEALYTFFCAKVVASAIYKKALALLTALDKIKDKDGFKIETLMHKDAINAFIDTALTQAGRDKDLKINGVEVKNETLAFGDLVTPIADGLDHIAEVYASLKFMVIPALEKVGLDKTNIKNLKITDKDNKKESIATRIEDFVDHLEQATTNYAKQFETITTDYVATLNQAAAAKNKNDEDKKTTQTKTNSDVKNTAKGFFSKLWS